LRFDIRDARVVFDIRDAREVTDRNSHVQQNENSQGHQEAVPTLGKRQGQTPSIWNQPPQRSSFAETKKEPARLEGVGYVHGKIDPRMLGEIQSLAIRQRAFF